MTPTMKSLGIDQFSVAQRILLVEEIRDSIAADMEQLPLTQAQKQDLERRRAAYEADRTAGSCWEDVKSRLRGQSQAFLASSYRTLSKSLPRPGTSLFGPPQRSSERGNFACPANV